MSRTYTLTSPILDLYFDGKPRYWRTLVALWLGLWITVVIGVVYTYTVVLPHYWGFETTLLFGIALLLVSQMGGDSE